MTRTVDLRIDVSSAFADGHSLTLAATVVLPDPERLGPRPVVCFAKPGGGYSRGYYTCDLPGPASGAQADHHADRGWIFVAIDNLGGGDSPAPSPHLTELNGAVAAAQAAENEILLRLANGVIAPGYPPVVQPVVIGIGHSTGALLTIVQQARHRRYDGIGVLGFSAVHSVPPTPPGGSPVVTAWFSRDLPADRLGSVLNPDALPATPQGVGESSAWHSVTWSFHYDDVPADVVEHDMAHYEEIAVGRNTGEDRPHPYNSRTTPSVARYVLTPGIVAPEAAAVTVPVFSGQGIRDLVLDPPGESRAFRSAPSFDMFICPRLGHMHNFGGTRALFWDRIHRFGEWCATFKAAKA